MQFTWATIFPSRQTDPSLCGFTGSTKTGGSKSTRQQRWVPTIVPTCTRGPGVGKFSFSEIHSVPVSSTAPLLGFLWLTRIASFGGFLWWLSLVVVRVVSKRFSCEQPSNSRYLEYVLGGHRFSKSEESCGKRWGRPKAMPCSCMPQQTQTEYCLRYLITEVQRKTKQKPSIFAITKRQTQINT